MGSYSYLKWGDYSLQVYFADDFAERNRGDEVPWKATFSDPGSYIDGIHEAWPDQYQGAEVDEVTPWYVVIKDRRICVAGRYGNTQEARDAVNEWLRREYDLGPPPHDWWPEIAWEARHWQLHRYDRPSTGDGLIDAISDFTRAKMREPGFFHMLFNERKPRLDLLEFVEQPVLAEFTPQLGWQWGNEMLCDAVEYRAERMLVEAGKWDATSQHPIFVTCKLVEGTLQLEIKQLCDRPRRLMPAPSN